MPSYGLRPWRRRGKNRYEILRAMREREMTKEALAELFAKTIGKFIPREKRKPWVNTNFRQTKISIPSPKLDERRFRQLLYDLKKEGLITPTNSPGKSYKLTHLGSAWIKKFSLAPNLPPKNYSVSNQQETAITVISYDIPEKLRIYRDWLRDVLRNLKLNPVHQSMYIGKVKLPPDFIKDIVQLKLDKYIEVFEITKAGTLLHRKQST